MVWKGGSNNKGAKPSSGTPSTAPDSPTFSSDGSRIRDRLRTSIGKNSDFFRRKRMISRSIASSVKSSSSSSSKNERPRAPRKDSVQSFGYAKNRRRNTETGKTSFRFHTRQETSGLQAAFASEPSVEAIRNVCGSNGDRRGISLRQDILSRKQSSVNSKSEKCREYEHRQSAYRPSISVSHMSEGSSAAGSPRRCQTRDKKTDDRHRQVYSSERVSLPIAEKESSVVDCEEGCLGEGAEEWKQKKYLASGSHFSQLEANKAIVNTVYDEGSSSRMSNIRQSSHHEGDNFDGDQSNPAVPDSDIHERQSGIGKKMAKDLENALKKLGSRLVDCDDCRGKEPASTSRKAAVHESYPRLLSKPSSSSQDKAWSGGCEELHRTVDSEDLTRGGSLLKKLKVVARERVFTSSKLDSAHENHLMTANDALVDRCESVSIPLAARNQEGMGDIIVEPTDEDGGMSSNLRPISGGKSAQYHGKPGKNSDKDSSSLKKLQSQESLSRGQISCTEKKGFKEECARFRRQLKALKEKSEGFGRYQSEKGLSPQRTRLGQDIFSSTFAHEELHEQKELDSWGAESGSEDGAFRWDRFNEKKLHENFDEDSSRHELGKPTSTTPSMHGFSKLKVDQTRTRLARMSGGWQSKERRKKLFVENILQNASEEIPPSNNEMDNERPNRFERSENVVQAKCENFTQSPLVSKEHEATSASPYTSAITSEGHKPISRALFTDANCIQSDYQQASALPTCKSLSMDEGFSQNKFTRCAKSCIASDFSFWGQGKELLTGVPGGRQYSVSDFFVSNLNDGRDTRIANSETILKKKLAVEDAVKQNNKHLLQVRHSTDFCKDAHNFQEKSSKSSFENWSKLIKGLRKLHVSRVVACAISDEIDDVQKCERFTIVEGALPAVFAVGETHSIQAQRGVDISNKEDKNFLSHRPTGEGCKTFSSQIASINGNDSSISYREPKSFSGFSKLSMRNTVPVSACKQNQSGESHLIDNLKGSTVQMNTLWQKVFPGLPELAKHERSKYRDSHVGSESGTWFEQDYNCEDFELQSTWNIGEGVGGGDEGLQDLKNMQRHSFEPLSRNTSNMSDQTYSDVLNAAQHKQSDTTGVYKRKSASLCAVMQEVQNSMEWVKRMVHENDCCQVRINDIERGIECLKSETDSKLKNMKTSLQEELQTKIHELLKEQCMLGVKEEQKSLQDMIQVCSFRIESVSRQADSSIVEIQMKVDEKLLGVSTKLREDLQTDVENLETGFLNRVESLQQQTDSRIESILEKSESYRREEMQKAELLLEQKIEQCLSEMMATLQTEKESLKSILKSELSCLWAEVDGLSKSHKKMIDTVTQLAQTSEKMKEDMHCSQDLAKHENTFVKKELENFSRQDTELKLELIEVKKQTDKMEALQQKVIALEGRQTILMKQLEGSKELEESLKHEMQSKKKTVEKLEEEVSCSARFEVFMEVKEDLRNLRSALEEDDAKEKILIMDKVENISHLFLAGLEEVRTDVLNVELGCREKIDNFHKQLEGLKNEQAYARNSASLLSDVLKRVSELECTPKLWQVIEGEKSKIDKALAMILYERDTAAKAASEAVNSASRAGEILEDVSGSLSADMADARRKSAQFQEHLDQERKMVLGAMTEARNLNQDLQELVEQGLSKIKIAIASAEGESIAAAGAASKALSFANEAEKSLSDMAKRVDTCNYLEKDFNRALGKVLEENRQTYAIKFKKIIARWERTVDTEVKNVQEIAELLKKEKKEMSLNVTEASTLGSRVEAIEFVQQEFHRQAQEIEKTVSQLTRTIQHVCDASEMSEKLPNQKEDHEVLQNEINRLDEKIEEVTKRVNESSIFWQSHSGSFGLSQAENTCKENDRSELHLKNLEMKIEMTAATQSGLADKIFHMRRRIHKLESMQINIARAVEEIRTSTGDLEKSAALWLPKYESGLEIVKEIKVRLGILEKSAKVEDKEAKKDMSSFPKDAGGKIDTWSKFEGGIKNKECLNEETIGKGSGIEVRKQEAYSAAADAEGLLKLEKRVEHVASTTLANLRILDAKVEHYVAGVDSALEGAAMAENKCSALGAELVRVFRILAALNKGNTLRWNEPIKPGEPAMATLSLRYHKTEISPFASKYSCDACAHCKREFERDCADSVNRGSKRQNGKGIKF